MNSPSHLSLTPWCFLTEVRVTPFRKRPSSWFLWLRGELYEYRWKHEARWIDDCAFRRWQCRKRSDFLQSFTDDYHMLLPSPPRKGYLHKSLQLLWTRLTSVCVNHRVAYCGIKLFIDVWEETHKLNYYGLYLQHTVKVITPDSDMVCLLMYSKYGY